MNWLCWLGGISFAVAIIGFATMLVLVAIADKDDDDDDDDDDGDVAALATVVLCMGAAVTAAGVG